MAELTHEQRRREAYRTGLQLAEANPGVPYDKLHIPAHSDGGRLERECAAMENNEPFAELLLAALEDGYVVGQAKNGPAGWSR